MMKLVPSRSYSGRFHFYGFPLGNLGLAENGSALTHLIFENDEPPAGASDERSPLLDRAAEQLAEYFAGSRREFDLPLAPAGTEFQRAVWAALREIPYGRTATYGQVARAVGREKACRAVGQANHRNPISIIIPCHRVVGGDGGLTGYGGGLEIKEYLLRLEDDVVHGRARSCDG